MAHKYHAKPTVYDGVRYDSKREAQYAGQLDLQRAARYAKDQVVQWDRQVGLPVFVNGVIVCRVVIDFVVHYADGRVEYHEVKGMNTPIWNLKRRMLLAQYPKLPLRIIK